MPQTSSTNFSSYVLDLPRPAKRVIVLALDVLLCVVSVLISFYLRLGAWIAPEREPFWPIIISVALTLPLAVSFGLYRAIFRYSGSAAVFATIKVILIEGVLFSVVFTFVGVDGVPRTIGLLQPIVLLLLLGFSRLLASVFFGETYQSIWLGTQRPRVMIYGAGSAGRQLASTIRTSGEMTLAGFIDDNPGLTGATLNGVRIYAPNELHSIVSRKNVSEVLLAMPSATRIRRGDIVQELKSMNLHVRTLPGLIDVARGKVSISDLKELDIEDLLGRVAVLPERSLLANAIEGKTVLVTGAGGSIGSELCRQIALIGPANLILVDQSEFGLYSIHQELMRIVASRGEQGFALAPLLASVTDETRISDILAAWMPDCIFHAAAYKHVPLVEHNPVDGVRNNVIGTLNVARLARKYEVGTFVLVSTDKAVRPTNIMGASKRAAEMVLQALNEEGGPTRFCMVRFGNVLGSSGSVVPLFRQQIAAGGPITLTHPEVIRYFMTIPEAAQLVVQSGAMAKGGEVFVLDMGEPVLIADLARNMIELSGLTMRNEQNPNGDIGIEFIGLRPGEKLYEELLIGDDPAETDHPLILRARERFLPWNELSVLLDTLIAVLEKGDARSVKTVLIQIVSEFKPTSDLVDLVTMANDDRR